VKRGEQRRKSETGQEEVKNASSIGRGVVGREENIAELATTAAASRQKATDEQ
jgi:hypothetical protein